MFNRYYERELGLLREYGDEFAKSHPNIASMLGKPSDDPDVERLIEGVAFLTGLLRQKLEDDFPEIIHELVQLIFPHYLRPLPAATIIQFIPKPLLKQSMTIPAGAQAASLPIEGTSCIFKTCYDVTVHPLVILDAAYTERSGQWPCITIAFQLQGINLADWHPGKLRLFLGGHFPDATNLYMLLLNRDYIQNLTLRTTDGDGAVCVLSPDYIEPVGFLPEHALIPYPSNSFPAYRLLQEYFTLPDKFLFIDIAGWDEWKDRGKGQAFEIKFEFKKPDFDIPKMKQGDFILSAAPAVNLFSHDADPVRLDHRETEYRVRPSGNEPSHYEVYSVDQVKGFKHGSTREKVYRPFEVFHPEIKSGEIYHVIRRKSLARADGSDIFLTIAYPPETASVDSETLSIQLTCTNGFLPQGIQIGDICEPTGTTPEFVSFTNIRNTTPGSLPPLGDNLLWRLLSHLSLNYATLANAENLKTLLDLYIFEGAKDRRLLNANKRRIDGIKEVKAVDSDRLKNGILLRGRDIFIKAGSDHFAGKGDLYLFGCVLDYFFGAYAALNSYTRFILEDTVKGDIYSWQIRLGTQFLI